LRRDSDPAFAVDLMTERPQKHASDPPLIASGLPRPATAAG
jgi:hypothetical protein